MQICQIFSFFGTTTVGRPGPRTQNFATSLYPWRGDLDRSLCTWFFLCSFVPNRRSFLLEHRLLCLRLTLRMRLIRWIFMLLTKWIWNVVELTQLVVSFSSVLIAHAMPSKILRRVVRGSALGRAWEEIFSNVYRFQSTTCWQELFCAWSSGLP